MELDQETKPVSRARRWLSYYLSFLMVFFQVSPAWAEALSDDWFQGVLDSEPLFQQVVDSNANELYESSLYIDEEELANYDSYRTIEKFYELMETRERLDLGPPTYIPVFVGGVATFIPTYPNSFNYMPTYGHFPSVGTPYVQTRLVANQLRELLNRTLIDPANQLYTDEKTQLITLYDNALRFAIENPRYEFGEPLKRHQTANGNSYDFIWPEVRMVNGQKALVPIVYLSWKTVSARKVDGIQNEIDGNLTANSLTIDDVNLQMGRDSFIQLANDLVNHQGSITSEGDLEIVAGGAVRNLSGVISSESDLSITASYIENRTLVYRYDLEGSRGQYLGEVAEIDANDNLTLTSHGDIHFIAAHAAAGDNVTLDAQGNIWLGSEQLDDYGNIDKDGWNGTWSSVDHMVSSISAGETLSLIAGGEIVVDAAEITSKGHIEILAGLGITVNSLTTSNQYKKKGTFGNTKKEVEAYKTVAMRALLDAGKSITMHTAMGDLTLRATDITSTEGTSLSASNGGINLLVAQENDHYSYTSVKESSVRTVYRQKGHDINTVAYPTIVGGLKTNALNGLHVEFGVDVDDSELSLEEQLDKLNGDRDLAWLEDLKNDPNVNWTAVETSFKEWNERQAALNPAVMAVITIIVAIATSGAGLGFGMSGTQLINAMATDFITNKALVAVVNAAFTSLVTQTSVGVANGDGVNALEDGIRYVVSEDSLKNLAVTAVTAGVMDQADTKFFEGISSEFVTEAGDSLSLLGQAAQTVTSSIVSAGAATLVNGEGSSDFEQRFVQSIGQAAINELGDFMAEKIGRAFNGTDATALDDALRYISHAGVGCIVGAASSDLQDNGGESGCAAGAGGALIGELVGDIYSSTPSYEEVEQQINGVIYNQENAEKVNSYLASNPDASTTEILSFLSKDSDAALSVLKSFNHLRDIGADIAKISAALGAAVAGADPSAINISADAGYRAAYYNALFSWQTIEKYKALLEEHGPAEAGMVFFAEYARNYFTELHQELIAEGKSGVITYLDINGKKLPVTYSSFGGVLEGLIQSAGDIAYLVDLKYQIKTNPLAAFNKVKDDISGTVEAFQNVDKIAEIPDQIVELYTLAHDEREYDAQAELGNLLAGALVFGGGVLVTGGAGIVYAGPKLLSSINRLSGLISDSGSALRAKVDDLLGSVVPVETVFDGYNPAGQIYDQYKDRSDAYNTRLTLNQHDNATRPDDSCAATCGSMVADTAGVDITPDQLSQTLIDKFKPDGSGLYLADVAVALRQNGVAARPLGQPGTVTMKQLENAVSDGHPAIVGLNIGKRADGSSIGHAVVLDQIIARPAGQSRLFKVRDPANGKSYVYSEESFDFLWGNRALTTKPRP